MDVSDPISSLIPSLDGPVVRALTVSNAPMSLSKVHERTGVGSVSGVRRVLKRLVAHGLVAEVPGGYVLNRDHVFAGLIEGLAGAHHLVSDRMRQWLDTREEPVHAAAFFGSWARRDGDADSDIDVLLVSDAPDRERLREDLEARLTAWTGNTAQVIVMAPTELRDLRAQDAPIVKSWAKDLVMILGDRREVLG